MASIRKRGNSYLLVVSMGYDPEGHRRKPRQKTVHPPEGLTPKAKEKWLEEEAALFERQCKNQPLTVDKSTTLAEYTAYWLAHIAPGKLAKSTLARDKQDIDRFLPALGIYKLTELRPEHFRNFYAQLRKQKNSVTGKPLSESTVEGVHACLCGILSDAMEGGKKKKRNVADEETTRKLIAALEEESIKYETYFKLIIATGMRRGECCGLRWKDVDFSEKTIHICRNVVKVTGEDILVKEPKTTAGDRYVYFSLEMASLLKEYRSFCQGELELHEGRSLTPEDYIFRRHGAFKLILKKHGLPLDLNVHSLRHTAASLMISGGADVATVSGLLGHSQVSTTLDIYTHAFDEKKREVSAQMQGKLDI